MSWRVGLLLVGLVLGSCTNDIRFDEKQQLAPLGPDGPSGEWEQAFVEECNAELDPDRINNFMPDGSGAHVHTWEPRGEYIDESNLSVAGGDCVITAEKLSMGGRDWVSGTMNTGGHFAQQYGYFEARLWPPAGTGFWPFWWLRAVDNQWPPSIEPFNMSIDQPHYTAQFYTVAGDHYGAGIDAEALTDGYHTLGVEWTESELTFYFDGVQGGQLSTGVANLTEPLYPILNLSINTGEYGPVPDDTTPSSAELRIDWLRVWRRPP